MDSDCSQLDERGRRSLVLANIECEERTPPRPSPWQGREVINHVEKGRRFSCNNCPVLAMLASDRKPQLTTISKSEHLINCAENNEISNCIFNIFPIFQLR